MCNFTGCTVILDKHNAISLGNDCLGIKNSISRLDLLSKNTCHYIDQFEWRYIVQKLHTMIHSHRNREGDTSKFASTVLRPISFNLLQWRHNGRDGVSNHQPHDCLLNRLFRRRSKKKSKPRVTSLCAGNSPVTGEFPAQMARNAENFSIWWRHYSYVLYAIGRTVLPNIFQDVCWSTLRLSLC